MTDQASKIVDQIPEDQMAAVLAAIRAKHFQYRDPIQMGEQPSDLGAAPDPWAGIPIPDAPADANQPGSE